MENKYNEFIVPDFQRKYKVKMIKQYNDQISELEKSSVKDKLILCCASAAVFTSIPFLVNQTGNVIDQLFNAFPIYVGSTAAIITLKNMIEAISNKTMLKGKIMDIENELKISEMAENALEKELNSNREQGGGTSR